MKYKIKIRTRHDFRKSLHYIQRLYFIDNQVLLTEYYLLSFVISLPFSPGKMNESAKVSRGKRMGPVCVHGKFKEFTF